METPQSLAEINVTATQTGLEELECGTLKDVSEKLKQLEVENSPSPSPRPNTDVNVNNQEEVVKLTEKCLNNAIESPGLNATRLPPDFKSNILKAQAEAVHKVTREDSVLSHKNASVQDAAANSAALNENNMSLPEAPLALMPATPTANGSALKDATDELDALLLSLTENLIGQTVTPQVSSTSTITPRWIVPQSGVMSNGLAGNGMSLAGKEGHDKEVISVISPPAPFLVDAVTSSSPTLAKEAVLKQKCLLTTEL
ncbi:band 4.1-like protein 5 [Dugong dugon]